MIKNIAVLLEVCSKKWSQLNDITPEYLSDAGKAAMEAYKTIYWHLSFHNSIESLVEDDEFKNLVDIPGKHPEFYKIVRKVNRAIDLYMKENK